LLADNTLFQLSPAYLNSSFSGLEGTPLVSSPTHPHAGTHTSTPHTHT